MKFTKEELLAGLVQVGALTEPTSFPELEIALAQCVGEDHNNEQDAVNYALHVFQCEWDCDLAEWVANVESQQTTAEVLDTKRLEIHAHTINRPECAGGCPRTVYHAWLKFGFEGEDVAKPLVIITIGLAGFVEWIHTDEQYRRRGFATEALRAVESQHKDLALDGATEAGEAFVAYYIAKFGEEEESKPTSVPLQECSPWNPDTSLPSQNSFGVYVYPDKSRIWLSERLNVWMACWADGTLLMGEDDMVSYFAKAEDAAKALNDSGEGPTSLHAANYKDSMSRQGHHATYYGTKTGRWEGKELNAQDPPEVVIRSGRAVGKSTTVGLQYEGVERDQPRPG